MAYIFDRKLVFVGALMNVYSIMVFDRVQVVAVTAEFKEVYCVNKLK